MNGHSCVNIDHYEAVGILKAAGSVIALRVEREEYPDGRIGGGYDDEPPTFSRSLPPPLQTSSTSSIRHNNKDQVLMSQEPAHIHTPMHQQTPQTNGIGQVNSQFNTIFVLKILKQIKIVKLYVPLIVLCCSLRP